MKKPKDKHFRPFKVLEKAAHSSFRCQLPTTWQKVHPVFNEVLLSLYKSLAFPSQEIQTLPPPILVDDTLEYEVEEILNSKFYRRKLKYLVKWKGYGSEENTWELEDNLTHAKCLIEEFHKRKPQALRRMDISQLRF